MENKNNPKIAVVVPCYKIILVINTVGGFILRQFIRGLQN